MQLDEEAVMGALGRFLCVIPFALAVAATVGDSVGSAQSPATVDETTRSVRRMLERLPYYGVFDFVAFSVDRGVVTLAGYSYQGLKNDAEMAAKRAAGVDEVVNKIEELPASSNDDRIRWATFYRIYADDFLSRYAPGGATEVFREILDERRFPGMQPVGHYPIHIIVKNGRTMLLGIVDSAADRQIAEIRAREVTGVFGVENGLQVAK
jgi:hyperosmotically inducible periplasmic protein